MHTCRCSVSPPPPALQVNVLAPGTHATACFSAHVFPSAPTLSWQVNVVDTPGTNVILGRQQRLTEEYVPRADLVRFGEPGKRSFMRGFGSGVGASANVLEVHATHLLLPPPRRVPALPRRPPASQSPLSMSNVGSGGRPLLTACTV